MKVFEGPVGGGTAGRAVEAVGDNLNCVKAWVAGEARRRARVEMVVKRPSLQFGTRPTSSWTGLEDTLSLRKRASDEVGG